MSPQTSRERQSCATYIGENHAPEREFERDSGPAQDMLHPQQRIPKPHRGKCPEEVTGAHRYGKYNLPCLRAAKKWGAVSSNRQELLHGLPNEEYGQSRLPHRAQWYEGGDNIHVWWKTMQNETMEVDGEYYEREGKADRNHKSREGKSRQSTGDRIRVKCKRKFPTGRGCNDEC